MTGLGRLLEKQRKRVIGLMSGTSADGMDAALVEIEGGGISTRVTQLAFLSLPYTDRIRGEILRLASGDMGGSRDLCLFHFLLGELALEACRAVCEKAGIAPETVDLVGSHGQTLYHQPEAVPPHREVSEHPAEDFLHQKAPGREAGRGLQEPALPSQECLQRCSLL